MTSEKEPILSDRTKEALAGIGGVANLVGWLIMAVIILGVAGRAIDAVVHGRLTVEMIASPFILWAVAAGLKRLAR